MHVMHACMNQKPHACREFFLAMHVMDVFLAMHVMNHACHEEKPLPMHVMHVVLAMHVMNDFLDMHA